MASAGRWQGPVVIFGPSHEQTGNSADDLSAVNQNGAFPTLSTLTDPAHNSDRATVRIQLSESK